MEHLLSGKKIAVLVESQYIPGEIAAYQSCFELVGAKVDLISRLWGQKKQTFVSEVEEKGFTPQTLDVEIDIDSVKVDDYAAVLMSANYTSVRLRYFQPPGGQSPTAAMVSTPPAVQFFADAMKNQRIIKGALCHGLWILTPNPHLLAGRKVTCHEVVAADVINAGADLVWNSTGVVVDDDLVTGNSWHVVVSYCREIIQRIV